MSALKFLIEKEFKQMLRDKVVPVLILIYPVMIMLIFPWAINFEIKNIRIDIVDLAKDSYSQRLTGKVLASNYFILNSMSPDYKTSQSNFANGDCDVILVLPPKFEKDLIKSQSTKAMIAVNAVNGTQGLLGNSYLEQIILSFSDELRQEKGINEIMNKSGKKISVVPNNKFNAELDYKKFMIPAFIVILVVLICGILPSMNIVSEKEKGTIQQINVTPVSKFNFILAKIIPHWIIGIVILAISMSAAYFMFGLYPTGSILAILLTSIIFILGISGLGIIISNYSTNLQQSMFLVMFFILIIILLSGIFTPVSSMPIWAQVIAYANPLTFYMDVMRATYLRGAQIVDILWQMGVLLAFAVVLNLWAVFSYKKSE